MPGQLVCADQDSLVAAFVAGVVLGASPAQLAKYGCQTIPKDAQVEILERFLARAHEIRAKRAMTGSIPSRQARTASMSSGVKAITVSLPVSPSAGSPFRSGQDFSYPWARGLEGAKTESLVIVADFSDRVSGVSANPLEDVEVF